MSEVEKPLKKSERTKARLIENAWRLFDEIGYEKTTMRKLAAESNVSPGLAYRYFKSKEELVFTLYEMLSTQTLTYVQRMKPAPLSENLEKTFLYVLKQLNTNSRSLEAFSAHAMDPRSDLYVLSEASKPIRERMVNVYQHVVEVSENDLIDHPSDALARLLYLGHLLLAFYWLHDRSKNRKLSRDLVKEGIQTLKGFAPMLALMDLSELEQKASKYVKPFMIV